MSMNGVDTQASSIPFVTVTNWVRAAMQCHIDIAAIFQAEGMDMSSLHPETAKIRWRTIVNIMERCVEATRRTGSGQHFPIVLGESFAFEYMSDVETFITTSASLRDAARSLEWISALVNPNMAFSVAEHGHQARIILQYNNADPAPDKTWHFSEASLTTTVKFSRMLLGTDAVINRITFRHGPHADSDAISRFFQAPVEYNADVDAIWFDRSMLERPLRGAFPSLHEQAAVRVARRVAQQHEHELSTEGPGQPLLVAQITRTFMAHPHLLGLGLDTLAQQMGIHTRTLQRRLKELGDSHSAIQGRVRYQLAQAWLRDGTLAIEDISDRLGFTDRRSFTQAFTRWSGKTPSQFRKSQA